MNNLLPRVSEAAVSKRVSESFFSNWRADHANPMTATISAYLESEFTPNPEDIKKYRANKLPYREPNFVSPEELGHLGPSPLSNTARGTAEAPGPVILQAHNIFTLNKSIYRPPAVQKTEDLVMCVDCRMGAAIEVYVQRSNSIRNSTLAPNQTCVRSLTGQLISDSRNAFYVMCTTAKRATITSTARQEIKEFRFRTDSKIGLEVEIAHNRLVVSKVHEDSQAAPLTLHLDGALIIAVNARRVTDLDEFQEAMAAARELPVVALLMASYKGGRGKAEDAHLFDLQKSKGMRSVLSNLFGPGRSDDDDHGDTEDDASSVQSHETHETHETQVSQRSQRSAVTKVSAASAKEAKDEKESEAKPLERWEAPGSKAPSRERRPRETRRYVYDSDEEEEKEEDKAEREAEEAELRNRRLLKQSSQRSLRSQSSQRSVTADAQSKELEVHFADKLTVHEDVADEVADSDQGMLAGKRQPAQTSLITTSDSNQAQGADDWNHLTTVFAEPEPEVEAVSVVPFVTLVCMPSLLRASKKYGKPRCYLQLTNFSQSSVLEVNWVDEDGALVCRTNLTPGQVHFELCSDEHVWALAAKSGGSSKPGKGAALSSQVSLSNASLASSVSHNVGYDPSQQVPVLIFRPSPPALAEGKCVTLMWFPFASISATQTVYPQTKGGSSADRVLPCVHVQLMDVPKSAPAMLAGSQEEQSLGKLVRKPLTRTRALNKWRKSKPKPASPEKL